MTTKLMKPPRQQPRNFMDGALGIAKLVAQGSFQFGLVALERSPTAIGILADHLKERYGVRGRQLDWEEEARQLVQFIREGL